MTGEPPASKPTRIPEPTATPPLQAAVAQAVATTMSAGPAIAPRASVVRSLIASWASPLKGFAAFKLALFGMTSAAMLAGNARGEAAEDALRFAIAIADVSATQAGILAALASLMLGADLWHYIRHQANIERQRQADIAMIANPHVSDEYKRLAADRVFKNR